MSLRLGGGALRNQQDGLIFSQAGALEVQAGSLDNRQEHAPGPGRQPAAYRRRAGQPGRPPGQPSRQPRPTERQPRQRRRRRAPAAPGLAEAGHRAVRQQRRRHARRSRWRFAPGKACATSRAISRRWAATTASSPPTSTTRAAASTPAACSGLDGQRFLNQGAAAGRGGKVGAGRIDFSLAGALANRFGRLESEASCTCAPPRSTTAAAACAPSAAAVARGWSLAAEQRLRRAANSASQDLDLQLGSLANAGGRILHTGNGTFGLDSGRVIRAGGELTTSRPAGHPRQRMDQQRRATKPDA
ncbi:hypothetical protein ACPA9J_17180 [Pseudomonas aeruginosa]